jgi:hypothetical protein
MLTHQEIAHELRIMQAERQFAKQGDREHWRILKELIQSRSPNAVAEIESRKGLLR